MEKGIYISRRDAGTLGFQIYCLRGSSLRLRVSARVALVPAGGRAGFICGWYSDKSAEHSPAVSCDLAKVMGRPARPFDAQQD